MKVDDCDFCALTAGVTDATYRCLYEGEERPIHCVAGFQIFPSIGPIADGHVLMVPSLHLPSFGALGSDDTRLAAGVLQRVRGLMASYWARNVVVFEHGVGASGGGCGISHAHLHLVPTDGVPSNLTAQPFDWRSSSSQDWMSVARGLTQGYLLVSPEPSDFLIAEAHAPPSQVLRAWLASELGLYSWDWRAADPVNSVRHALDFLADERHVQVS